MKKIKLHSVVGAITNSSTEIYTWMSSKAITIAKRHLETLMKVFGTSGSVDQEFEIEAMVEYYDKEMNELVKKIAKTDAELEEINNHLPESSCGYPMIEEYSLTVRSKRTGEVVDLTDAMGLLAQDAAYNG